MRPSHSRSLDFVSGTPFSRPEVKRKVHENSVLSRRFGTSPYGVDWSNGVTSAIKSSYEIQFLLSCLHEILATTVYVQIVVGLFFSDLISGPIQAQVGIEKSPRRRTLHFLSYSNFTDIALTNRPKSRDSLICLEIWSLPFPINKTWIYWEWDLLYFRFWRRDECWLTILPLFQMTSVAVFMGGCNCLKILDALSNYRAVKIINPDKTSEP